MATRRGRGDSGMGRVFGTRASCPQEPSARLLQISSRRTPFLIVSSGLCFALASTSTQLTRTSPLWRLQTGSVTTADAYLSADAYQARRRPGSAVFDDSTMLSARSALPWRSPCISELGRHLFLLATQYRIGSYATPPPSRSQMSTIGSRRLSARCIMSPLLASFRTTCTSRHITVAQNQQ